MVAKTKAVSNEVLDVKLGGVNDRLDKIDETLKSVAGSLTEMVRLEERFAAQSERQTADRAVIADHETRIGDIEKILPPLMEARRWVIAGVIGIVAMVGLTVYNNFFSTSSVATRNARVTVTQPVEVPPGQ